MPVQTNYVVQSFHKQGQKLVADQARKMSRGRHRRRQASGRTQGRRGGLFDRVLRLITEGEALEVAGAEDKAALLAAAGLKRGDPTAIRPVAFRSDKPARDPRPSRT